MNKSRIPKKLQKELDTRDLQRTEYLKQQSTSKIYDLSTITKAHIVKEQKTTSPLKVSIITKFSKQFETKNEQFTYRDWLSSDCVIELEDNPVALAEFNKRLTYAKQMEEKTEIETEMLWQMSVILNNAFQNTSAIFVKTNITDFQTFIENYFDIKIKDIFYDHQLGLTVIGL